MKTSLKLLFFICISLFIAENSFAQIKKYKLKPGQAAPQYLPEDTVKDSVKTSEYIYRIINAPEDTYGYDILKDEKVIIHQTNVPGAAGLRGFTKRTVAVDVAWLVIQKMKNGQMPPTVTKAEIEEIERANQ